MNIQSLTSPQTMAVPSMRMQRRSEDQSMRALPRAIPNARFDSAPGIPSMEAPPSIFGDYRHRLPKLPPLKDEEDERMDEPGSPIKGGISSLKDRIGGFEAMDVDMDQGHSLHLKDGPPSDSSREGDSPTRYEDNRDDRPTLHHWRTHSSSTSLANELVTYPMCSFFFLCHV